MDGFALLGVPQNVLVEETVLKNAWHRAAARAENPEPFHLAYSTLRDPAKRVEHLLTLHGREVAGADRPGSGLFDLFFSVAAILKTADEIQQQIDKATSALQRASLTPRLLASLDQLTETAGTVEIEKNSRNLKLESLSAHFPNLTDPEWTQLAAIGHDFAFLGKWESEIQKRSTRLQETLIGKIV